MVTRAVSSNNRIAVPADYWNQIGVCDGINVDVSVEKNSVVIRKSMNNASIEAQVKLLEELVKDSDLTAQGDMLNAIHTIIKLINKEKEVPV